MTAGMMLTKQQVLAGLATALTAHRRTPRQGRVTQKAPEVIIVAAVAAVWLRFVVPPQVQVQVLLVPVQVGMRVVLEVIIRMQEILKGINRVTDCTGGGGVGGGGSLIHCLPTCVLTTVLFFSA